MKLGINGMGRIGKLTLWSQVARKQFDGLVINLGREVGCNLHDVAQVVEKDSSYGRLGNFLHGHRGGQVIDNVDDAAGTMTIDGMPVTFLRTARNPKEIPWRDNDVRLVVDTTGAFADPTTPADAPGGALRGHLEGGAEKVLLSAPFKIRSRGLSMPDDAVTAVMGINEADFDPGRHAVLSAASCTTTCLSFMMKPLIDHFGVDRMLSASMVTVHAATGSQMVLDAVPRAAASDLRKNRSVMNNIILTTTGAAKALAQVIPEVSEIGFMAESVRVPIATGSLIILTVNLQSEDSANPINRERINTLFHEAASGIYGDYLVFCGDDQQNVSADIIGAPGAAAVIEGRETHTRTAFTRVNLDRIPGLSDAARSALESHTLDVPVTQAVIYGWYDNELGSYTNMLCRLTDHIAAQMF